MLSFGYSILLSEIIGKIEAKGLNSYFGFIHQRGMQIAELRKKYGLKKSDIETLFKFVEECYDKISSDATNGKWYDFEIYKTICSEAERRLIAEGKLQFEMDEKTEERTVEDFDEECFIRITDNVSLILKS